MDRTQRRELASQALAGYLSGPHASTGATARALASIDGASALVLVEGQSDQIAIETLAVRQGRDLHADRVVVVPIGGAHAVARFLTRFGPAGAGLRLAGLCDAGEENILRRALAAAGLGEPSDRTELRRLGFHVCVDDLEDELIRAAGPLRVEALFEDQGDLGSFRSLQRQPAWRDRPPVAQMRRFLSSGARRKQRYARLLVDALDPAHIPSPLTGVLSDV